MRIRYFERAANRPHLLVAAACVILGTVLVGPAPGAGGLSEAPGSIGNRSRRTVPGARVRPVAAVELLETAEIAKLTAANADDLDHLGTSVAIDGTTLIAGAFRDSHEGSINAGSASVFARDSGGDGSWAQVTELVGSDTASCDYFGSSVAISGATTVVGARHNSPEGLSEAGAAYVFMRDQGGDNAWGEVTKLTAADAEPGDSFGLSVGISGDIVVVGSAWEDANGLYHAGSVYIFMRDLDGKDAWGQLVKLTASDAEEKDEFGASVAVDGDTVVVGAPGDIVPGLLGTGSAYIFMRDLGGPNNWGELTKITGSDLETGDEFGASVAISGGSVVVGVAGSAGEKAYIFDRDSGGSDAWGQVAKLAPSDAGSKDDFGQSVTIDRDTVVVGAKFGGLPNQAAAGAVYIFMRNEGGTNAWGEAAKLSASDAENEDQFGVSVAIDDSLVVVGANRDDQAGLTNPGSVYVFQLAHPWIPLFSDGLESGDTAVWSMATP